MEQQSPSTALTSAELSEPLRPNGAVRLSEPVRLNDEVRTDTGWDIVEDRLLPERAVTIGSNFLAGNGYLGYRMTWPDQTADDFVGCTVSDTYDMADGRWRELCNAPNGLFVRLTLDGRPLRRHDTRHDARHDTAGDTRHDARHDTAGDTRHDTPGDTRHDTPGDTRHDTPGDTPGDTAGDTAGDTPGDTAGDTAEAEIHLDLRRGLVTLRSIWSTDDGRSAEVVVRRFAGLHDLHLLAQEVQVTALDEGTLGIEAGIDARVWSLNGDHFASHARDVVEPDGILVHEAVTIERGATLAVAAQVTVRSDGPQQPGNGSVTPDLESLRIVRGWQVPVRAGATVTVTTGCGVTSSNDGPDPVDRALTSARHVADNGFEVELERSTAVWQRFWDRSDVVIEGDPAAQAALRFCLYHNRIATPAHSDRLPIGARGLSCQAYQGAAFWDQEIFNLPAFLFTEPHIARNLLVYRWHTLDGARRKARRLGYEGAFYAWISGDTGDELCPDFFFVDVLTGRPIRNHFNDWQIHVSPDISFTVWRYWTLTADWEFMVDHGAEILFEVARFCHSFVLYNERRDRYECRQLLGPDEWHENVHNDTYTNHVVHMALGHALDAADLLRRRNPTRLDELLEQLEVTEADLAAWQRIRDLLYLPAPDPETHVIEQFDGFFELEECWPEDLVDRLADPSEYWGWPNGVAMFTQVSKQPAVLQLFHLDHTVPLEIQGANYAYYEPRCAHGSSLSHSVHALVATRLGLHDEAYRYFWQTATIDLLSTSKAVVGGTFIGGMHTAACGGAYQAAVFGFGGLDADDGVLLIDPRLPPRWEAIEFGAELRGQRVRIRADHEQVTITADADNVRPTPVRCRGDALIELAPGEALVRRGDHVPW